MGTKSNEAAIVRLVQRVEQLEMYVSKLEGQILVLKAKSENDPFLLHEPPTPPSAPPPQWFPG